MYLFKCLKLLFRVFNYKININNNFNQLIQILLNFISDQINNGKKNKEILNYLKILSIISKLINYIKLIIINKILFYYFSLQ